MADSTADGSVDTVVVGRVGPARGVKGEVFVQPFTDAPEERFAAGSVLLTEPAGRSPLTVESANFAGPKLVVHFAGVDDRNAAEALRGTELRIPASERPELDDPDEFYTSDLIGLAARTVQGADLGPIADVIEIAGADYLVLTVEGAERLVPFVAAIVPTVDISGGFVLIDPPEGLLDL
jgi:16S rRNA processing protein RimM